MTNDFERVRKDIEETNAKLEQEHLGVRDLQNQNLSESQIECMKLTWVSTTITYMKSNDALINSITNYQSSVRTSIKEIEDRYSSLINTKEGELLNTTYEKKVENLINLIYNIRDTFRGIMARINARIEAENYLYQIRYMITNKCKEKGPYNIPNASITGFDRGIKDDETKEYKITKNKDQISISEKIRSIICRH